jgi:hypothetical protein
MGERSAARRLWLAAHLLNAAQPKLWQVKAVVEQPTLLAGLRATDALDAQLLEKS